MVKLQALDWLGGDEGHKGPVDALLLREMLQTLGSSYSSTTEDNLIKEMKKLSVPHHSNLVSIVQLRSLTQEREEHRLMLLESTTSLHLA